MKYDMNLYQEIRGTLVRKRRSFLGKHYLYIDDGAKTVRVIIGKAAFSFYKIGMKLTVGYIGHRIINIRPGIVENED